MDPCDNDRNIALYSKLLAEYGNDTRSLNWGSRQSQEKRFEVLLSPGVKKGARILDVGCGLGDLCGWMERKGLDFTYHGVDITPGMIDRARQLHPGRTFDVCDILEQPVEPADIVVASGVFYLRSDNPEDYMKQMVKRMYLLSKSYLSFNSLSLWGRTPEANEFCADPTVILEYCRTFCPRLLLRHDYHPGDFSITLFKPEFT